MNTLITGSFSSFDCEETGENQFQGKCAFVAQLTTFHSRDKGLGTEEEKGEKGW